jgi:hypothetical protein
MRNSHNCTRLGNGWVGSKSIIDIFKHKVYTYFNIYNKALKVGEDKIVECMKNGAPPYIVPNIYEH